MSTPYNYGNIETPTYSDAQKSILPLNAMVSAVEALTTAVALRGYIGVRQMVAWVQGSATVNDGGAGQFHWSPTSTTADDGGTTSIAPIGPAATAIATGRWLRDTLASTSLALVQQAYNTNAATTNAVVTGAQITGGTVMTTLNMTGTLGGAATLTLPIVANLVLAFPTAVPGQTYQLRIMNSSSANFAWTVTTNTGWTLNGTVAIAQNTWNDYIVTFTTLAAVTLRYIGSGVVT